jgi:hypothetical protein
MKVEFCGNESLRDSKPLAKKKRLRVGEEASKGREGRSDLG